MELLIEKLNAIIEFATQVRDSLSTAPTAVEEPKAEKKSEKKAEPKADKKAKKEEPAEEVQEAVNLDDIIAEYEITDMSPKDIKEYLDENGVEYDKKAKKDALVTIFAQAIADGKIPLDGEDSDDANDAGEAEDDEEVDLQAMSLPELLALAKEYELDVPKKLQKDKDKLIDFLVENLGEDEEAEEGEDAEEEEDFEASPERLEKEKEIEDRVQTAIKNKKLTVKKMREFLADYFEDDPDCHECNCSDKETTECYLKIKTALVDDDGDEHELADAYMRNDKVFCCGKECALNPDNENQFICEICGSKWDAD